MLAFGLSRLQGALIGGLVVMVAIIVLLAFVRNDGVKAGVAKDAKRTAPIIAGLERDLGTCRGNVTALEGSLQRQGEAVEALKRESEARVAQSRKEAQAARAVAESYRQSAAAILEAKPGDDLCRSAEQLIDRVAQ